MCQAPKVTRTVPVRRGHAVRWVHLHATRAEHALSPRLFLSALLLPFALFTLIPSSSEKGCFCCELASLAWLRRPVHHHSVAKPPRGGWSTPAGAARERGSSVPRRLPSSGGPCGSRCAAHMWISAGVLCLQQLSTRGRLLRIRRDACLSQDSSAALPSEAHLGSFFSHMACFLSQTIHRYHCLELQENPASQI